MRGLLQYLVKIDKIWTQAKDFFMFGGGKPMIFYYFYFYAILNISFIGIMKLSTPDFVFFILFELLFCMHFLVLFIYLV